jgi:hypothetical protein
MKSSNTRKVWAYFVITAGFVLIPQLRAGTKSVVRGWLSDENCATSRATTGNYTATNLKCARECIAKGKKIALIDPEGKRVLILANQDAGKKNIGDFVEITGEIDSQTRMLHVDSLKFLDNNRAMCAVPAKVPAGK